MLVSKLSFSSSDHQLIQLPISQEAYDLLLLLPQDLDDLPIIDQLDIWTYIWRSPTYQPTKAYKHLIGTRQVHPSFNWLWKSSIQKKHKVFFGILLKDRLSTRNLLRRKNKVLPSDECVFVSVSRGGISRATFPKLLICTKLLGFAESPNPGRGTFCGSCCIQRSVACAFLHGHGHNYHNELVHLDGSE
jgi:hypothetical protein